MKKTKIDGLDIYIPTKPDDGHTVFWDDRADKSKPAKYAVEYDRIKKSAKMVCLICGMKTKNIEKFQNHNCFKKTGDKLK